MKLLLTVCFAALVFASAQTCDIQTGLSCAKSVEPCIATCKTGALACAKCLASDWGACCPCIEKAIPKIPFKCPNATSRVQLEGTIAAPAHWAMAAEAPASTDLTSVYMFLMHADGAEEQLEQILLEVHKNPSTHSAPTWSLIFSTCAGIRSSQLQVRPAPLQRAVGGVDDVPTRYRETLRLARTT